MRKFFKVISGYFEKSAIRHTLANKDGNTLPLIMISMFILFSFSIVMVEVYRIHSIHSHIEHELQRAVNIAVEDAMEDSWRQDKLNMLNVSKAHSDFHSYLQYDLGLNGAHQMIKDGQLIYTLEFDIIDAQIDPPMLLVSGEARVRSAFAFLADDILIPFNIRSKNFRVDG